MDPEEAAKRGASSSHEMTPQPRTGAGGIKTQSTPAVDQNWEILTCATTFEAAPYVRVERQRVRLPDGREIDDYFNVVLRDYVCVFAETGDGRLLALRSYKHGARGIVMSLPAGYLEPGEAPLRAAQRELVEETGYAAGEWRGLGSYTINGNQGCGAAHLFIAKDCRRVDLPNHGDLEEMELLTLTPDEVAASIRAGAWKLLDHLALVAIATNHRVAAALADAGGDA